MARVPYPQADELPAGIRTELDRLAGLNIFRMLAASEEALSPFVALGTQLLFRTALDPVLREIAILRVGTLSNAAYEVFQHERIGRGLGMSPGLLAAIRRGPDDPAFDERQRQVMAYTDDVVRNVRAGDATFRPLLEALGLKQLQELTLAIGYYMMVCRFLETFGVDIEPDADPSTDPLRRRPIP